MAGTIEDLEIVKGKDWGVRDIAWDAVKNIPGVLWFQRYEYSEIDPYERYRVLLNWNGELQSWVDIARQEAISQSAFGEENTRQMLLTLLKCKAKAWMEKQQAAPKPVAENV
jgi:hypothetical protein